MAGQVAYTVKDKMYVRFFLLLKASPSLKIIHDINNRKILKIVVLNYTRSKGKLKFDLNIELDSYTSN